MADNSRLFSGFLIGEAAGRIEVPLPELPSDIAAFTVPKSSQADDDQPAPRVPRDRKRRVRVTRVDLLARYVSATLEVPKRVASRDMVWILRTGTTRRWAGMTARFGGDAWEVALELVRSGVGVVRCAVSDFNYEPQSFRLTEAWAAVAQDHVAELVGQLDPDTARADVLQLLKTVPQLDDEQQLLASVQAGAPLRAPAGTRTGTNAWSVYEAAIRAACIWIPDNVAGKRHTAKSLAGFAFRDSKQWTSEREIAFANLIGRPFHSAVDDPDIEILMRGPLQWVVGSVIADASACEPWIGLPATGLRLLGTRDVSGLHGVLLVENKDTFERVCLQPDVVNRWLCLWGRGYASRGLISLLAVFGNFPLAAWCDLDADGIGIVANLSRRLKRVIHPVGMDASLWVDGPYRRQDEDQLTRGRAVAAKLSAEGPMSLKALADQIAVSGEGREQETLYEEVLPTLPQTLRALE